MRCQIVLLSADGLASRVVAEKLRINRGTVELWRRTYEAEGCQGLIRERVGRKPMTKRE